MSAQSHSRAWAERAGPRRQAVLSSRRGILPRGSPAKWVPVTRMLPQSHHRNRLDGRDSKSSELRAQAATGARCRVERQQQGRFDAEMHSSGPALSMRKYVVLIRSSRISCSCAELASSTASTLQHKGASACEFVILSRPALHVVDRSHRKAGGLVSKHSVAAAHERHDDACCYASRAQAAARESHGDDASCFYFSSLLYLIFLYLIYFILFYSNKASCTAG